MNLSEAFHKSHNISRDRGYSFTFGKLNEGVDFLKKLRDIFQGFKNVTWLEVEFPLHTEIIDTIVSKTVHVLDYQNSKMKEGDYGHFILSVYDKDIEVVIKIIIRKLLQKR